jgi:ABC-type uncharacterized transport system permease subunit
MDPLTNPAFVLFSAISPMLIAFVKQSGWSAQVNAIVALVCYIVIGIAGAIVSGEALTLENAVALIAVATAVGTVAYQLIWSNIGVGASEGPSVEERLLVSTSLVKG